MGVSEINNLLMSDDVLHTLNAFKTLGVNIEKSNNKIIIYGEGLNSLKKPNKNIYLGNSGTSARLLTGLLSSQNFETTLEGDQSLSTRPMARIMDPLKLMGAKFENISETLPLKIIDKVYIVNEGSVYFEGSPDEAVRDENIKRFYLGSDFKI